MLNKARQIVQKLKFKLFQAPKGYGLPYTTEVWDKQYKDGVWNFLDSVDELANYMVTVGYVHHFSKSLNDAPRVLDLGCGDGNLAALLSHFQMKSYLGLDVSVEAVRQATACNIPAARFQIANFEAFELTEKFDFILSTGSISYATDPVVVLQRYADALSENGAFIISLWRYGYNGVIWQNIEKHFEVLDAAVVTNRNGQMWDIKVIR